MSNIYTKETIEKLISNNSKTLAIHYSNFENDYEPFSKAISTIVIKSLDNSIYKCFSIHLEADLGQLDIDTIEDEYINLEYMVLLKFSNFLKSHQDYMWLHWDMNKMEYGFEALKHRFEKLSQGQNEQFGEISTHNIFDLNKFFETYYGQDFAEGPDKLKSLVNFNKVNILNQYLDNSNESINFNNKNYKAVLNSVELKVKFISEIPILFKNNTLKIPKKNFYRKFINFISHPITSFSGLILGLIIGLYSNIK